MELAPQPFSLSAPKLAPPSNIQAEQALLGAILANNKAYDAVRGFLRPEAFADAVHTRIYQAIKRRVEAGLLADAVTLKAEFEHAGILDEVGGTAYLAQLLTAMVGIINAGEYGRAILDCWLRRREAEVSESWYRLAMGTDGFDAAASVAERLAIVHEAVADIEGLAASASSGTVLYSHAVGAAIDRADAIYGGRIAPPMPTGITAMDNALGGGLMPATLNYLAGLGEVGKTALAFQIAESVATNVLIDWQRRGQTTACPGVLFVSFEMTAEQLGTRATARLARVPLRTLKRGELTNDVTSALVGAQQSVEGIPLEIADGEPASLARAVTVIRSFCRRRQCAMAVIDSLTKIVADRANDLLGAYLNATTTLEKLAKELGIAILLLVHLPQSVAKRDNPRPRRGDLPYGIHAQATGAVGLWRPVLALSQSPPERGRMGEEAHQKLVDEWNRKRESLRNVSELVPLKVRDDDDGSGGEIGRLIYNQTTKTFEEPQASFGENGYA
jgi:replicative DNA helicase